jgi:RecA-family ATPase
MWLGLEVADVEKKILDPAWRTDLFGRLGSRADHIDWVFASHITGKGLGERLNAFAEVRGEYPHLVVLDNMSNCITNPESEYSEIKEMQTAMQGLARQSNAHIAILHHAKGVFDDGQKPIPQSGGLQNPFKIPELGLTLFKPDDNRLGVCRVKDRGGRSDPGAKDPVYLPVDFARASVLVNA